MGHPYITDLFVKIHDCYAAEFRPRTGEVAVAE